MRPLRHEDIRRLGLHLARVLHEAGGQGERTHVKAARVLGGQQDFPEPGPLHSGDGAVDERLAESIEFEQFLVTQVHAAPSNES